MIGVPWKLHAEGVHCSECFTARFAPSCAVCQEKIRCCRKMSCCRCKRESGKYLDPASLLKDQVFKLETSPAHKAKRSFSRQARAGMSADACSRLFLLKKRDLLTQKDSLVTRGMPPAAEVCLPTARRTIRSAGLSCVFVSLPPLHRTHRTQDRHTDTYKKPTAPKLRQRLPLQGRAEEVVVEEEVHHWLHSRGEAGARLQEVRSGERRGGVEERRGGWLFLFLP